MEKQIIIKNGENYELDKLVIEDNEFDITKYYIDNLPCMYNYLDGWVPYDSFEDCVKKLKYDCKKNPTEMSVLLNKIIDNDNPLIVSDSFKKLIDLKTNVGIETIFRDGLLEMFSIKRDDNNFSVDIDEYRVMNDDGTFLDLVPITEEEVKAFGDFINTLAASK